MTLIQTIKCFLGFHDWMDLHADRVRYVQFSPEHYTEYVGNGCICCGKIELL